MNTRALLLLTSALLCLSLPVAADPASPWGINTHVPNDRVLDMVSDADIGWVRLDFNWFTLEPERDRYNWGYMDHVVSAARSRGLEIFATLAYSPAWANGTGNIADPPLDPNDWYDFVFDTVSRYRGSIKHWGMWNEPNLEGFFTGEGWQYREWILKPGAQAAKAADPSCLVLAPELAHLSSSDWPDWMDEATKEGGADYIDIITHHCYKGDTGEELFKYLDEGSYWPWDDPPLLNVLKNLNLDDKPVWLTETGWDSVDYLDDPVSEQAQADNYHQLLWGVYTRDYLEKVFPYEIIDDPTEGVPHWGIIRSDYTPKPAYATYSEFIAAPSEPEQPGCGEADAAGQGASQTAALLVLGAAVLAPLRRRPRK